MVLRSSEVEKVIQYYFSKYKGENCYELHSRIRDSFAGVSKHVIQEWINSNRKHCESHPIFENIDPLQPIIAKSPMDVCQLIWWSWKNIHQNGITTKHISIS